MSTALLDIEDLGEAVREGRPLRPAQRYRIRFAQGDLNFRPLEVSDPVPLGRQILQAAGLGSTPEISLFAILPSGDFEDVRLDEPFDLRAHGAERFIAFQTDRSFKLTLNGHQIEWGKPVISGAALYALAKASANEAVFLKVQAHDDRMIEQGDLVDLAAPGVEHFYTAARPVPTYEIIVNSRPRVVHDPKVTFEQVVQIAFPGSHDPNVTFTVTFRHAASRPHAGELGAGGSVEVQKKDTVFNVTRTVQS
jgi:hypothetical protein